MAATPDALTAVGRLRPWLTYPAWGACLCLGILAPCFPVLAVRYEFYPFALGLVLLGLPHGALDHLVWPHLRRQPITPGYLAGFIAGYSALVLLYLAFWRVSPPAALVGFLIISWLHWGQGDYDYFRFFEGRSRPKSRLGVLLIWLVRGGLPIFLPVLAFPKTFARVGAGLMHWYGGRGVPVPEQGVVSLGLATLLALIGLYLWQARREDGGDRRKFWRDVWELFLLLFLLGRVPPLLAVGTYFCVWHSARHIGRLMLTDPATSVLLSEGRMREGVWRTTLQSLPMTAGAVILLAGLYIAQRHHGAFTLSGLVYLYLSLISALTLPHFLVVLWMDRHQCL